MVRAYYAKEGRAGLFPLEARLNLPERKHSYVLQEWMASKVVETSYEKAAAWVNKHLHLEMAHRPFERVTGDCTETVKEFMDSLAPPPTQLEGPILVDTVDCKRREGITLTSQPTNQAARTSFVIRVVFDHKWVLKNPSQLFI